MVQTTQAIVCRDSLQREGWKLEEVTVRSPLEGELLVEMTASGICHSDLITASYSKEAVPGAYPRVIGHEGAGYVKAVGPGVTVASISDPVLCSFQSCQDCYMCKAKSPTQCNSFSALNVSPTEKIFGNPLEESPSINGAYFGQSSFARLTIVKQGSIVNAKGLVKSKEELRLFAPLGCGVQTGSGSITNVADAREHDIVCVIGLGGVGLSAVMSAKQRKCKGIVGIDKVQSRLDLAKELGCTNVVDTSSLGANESLIEHVRRITEGMGPTVTLDTTGVPALIEDGLEFTRTQGKYLQVGIPKDFGYEVKISVLKAVRDGKWFVGACEGWADPQHYIPKMIEWYRDGSFQIDKMIQYYPAEKWQKAVNGTIDGSVIKPVICWD